MAEHYPLRSSALLALTKLMALDAAYCDTNLRLLFTLLQTTQAPPPHHATPPSRFSLASHLVQAEPYQHCTFCAIMFGQQADSTSTSMKQTPLIEDQFLGL